MPEQDYLFLVFLSFFLKFSYLLLRSPSFFRQSNEWIKCCIYSHEFKETLIRLVIWKETNLSCGFEYLSLIFSTTQVFTVINVFPRRGCVRFCSGVVWYLWLVVSRQFYMSVLRNLRLWMLVLFRSAKHKKKQTGIMRVKLLTPKSLPQNWSFGGAICSRLCCLVD